MTGGSARHRIEWLILLVLLLIVTGFVSFLHLASTDQLRASERQRIQVFTDVLANDIENNLIAINRVLDDVIRDHLDGTYSASSGVSLTRHLQRLETAMPGVRALVVVDATGKVSATSTPILNNLDLSSRSYFKQIQAHPDKATLFVSPPFRSLKKDVIITLSRMLPAIDGSFGGVVLATFDPHYFTGIFRQLAYIPDLRTVVIHGDGRLFLSYPALPDVDFSSPDQTDSLFMRHRRSGLADSVQSGPSSTGEERVMAMRSVSPASLSMDKPMVIGISRSVAAIDQPMQRWAGWVTLFCVALALISCSALFCIQRHRRRLSVLQAARNDEREQASLLMQAAGNELSRSHNALQAVFDNMNEAIFVLDQHGTLLRINDAGRTIHGLMDTDATVPDVIAGIELLSADGRRLPGAEWPTVRGLRGDFVHDYALEVRRIDTGAQRALECSTAAIRTSDGALDMLIVTFRDVSGHRLSSALRDSESRFRTLIEDAPLAIVILRRGLLVYANPRYNVLHGYGVTDDLAGMPWRSMIAPESIALLVEQETLIGADSATDLRFEAIGLGKDDCRVPVYKTTTRVALADGSATLIFAQDISAQKAAEAAVLQALDSAEAANHSKADFLANMSHEIRSPLNAILGLAYLLEQSALERDASTMVAKIRSSGRMLLGIINDVLDVSKIEAGHMVIEQVQFRLADLIDNVAASMGIAAGDKHLELLIRPLPDGVILLTGDALRLEQVLVNLTSNAIKFTANGQVELRVELVSRSDDQLTLRFSVRDTGIGIPVALQDDVFSAFTQADSSTTRRFGGTGLGLTICRKLVALMGGGIGMTSTPGIGSEFWFTVPLQQDGSERTDQHPRRLSALIADDSEIALKNLDEIASGLGWNVSTRASGEAVLATLLEQPGDDLPEVIVLDWKMPGAMDGIATARAIRAALPVDRCPIVIMATTYSLGGLAGMAGNGLVDGILAKPVTASTLYNAVTEAQYKRGTGLMTPDATDPASRQDLAGIRVLIVDDSEINRDVAQRILSVHGAVVTLAVDGKETLDWLLSHGDEVDMVLMDVQMPVMDGIEATRRLRLLPQFDDLPVIALTAGAFKSQQEAAQAAGMNHFISKPFDVASTVMLIRRLRRLPAIAPLPPALLQVAFAVMDTARGLQLWLTLPAYRDYLQRFAASYVRAIENINASLAGDDLAAATALVHKLSGDAANMALPDTHRLAGEAERVLLEGRDPTRALTQLDDALQQALRAIARFTSTAPGNGP
ncbi:MAG: PAS domain S-box-containing protein [Bradyrhizobium sp.]|jgi:PAS domain S-box-containing protein